MIAWISLAITVAVVGVASLKWFRVAQREHYLTGGYQAAYVRWAASSTTNRIIGTIPWLPVVLVPALGAPSWIVVIGAAARVVFPLGLGFNGTTSPLAWTDRLKRLAAVYAVLLAVLLGIGLVANPAFAAALVLVGSIVAMPVALLVAGPIERQLSRRFVTEATATLHRIDPTVVAITGSYGKTSTKEYIRHLVDGTRQVVASPASFNNRMGLARAVNEHVAADTEVFIAEMGTYGPGEIAEMCEWVRPSVAVLTAIGPVHLERFGNEDRIVTAKSEILVGAELAVINVDDERLATVAESSPTSRTIRCSAADTTVDLAVVASDDQVEIWSRGRSIGRADDPGVFRTNLACAIAVALELGVSEATVIRRVGSVPRPSHRQTVFTSDAGVTIIDDTYNANPAGAAAALDRLVAVGASGRRVVVTPGMVELGRRQSELNEAFARQAGEVATDVVIVGQTNRGALRKGTAGGAAAVIVMADRGEAVDWVRQNLGPGDAVLYENDLPDHYP